MLLGRGDAFQRADICELRIVDNDADGLGGVHDRTAADGDDAVCIEFAEGFDAVLDILNGGIGLDVGVESMGDTDFVKDISDFFDLTGLDHVTAGGNKSALIAATAQLPADFPDGAGTMIRNRIQYNTICHKRQSSFR